MSQATQAAYSKTVGDADMHLTGSAEAKMAELIKDADVDVDGIRIFVSGGGCSGMTYGMTYAEAAGEYDSLLEGRDYKVVVDAVALNYLRGCEIDFSEKGFTFRNVFQAVGGSGACGGCGGAAH